MPKSPFPPPYVTTSLTPAFSALILNPRHSPSLRPSAPQEEGVRTFGGVHTQLVGVSAVLNPPADVDSVEALQCRGRTSPAQHT